MNWINVKDQHFVDIKWWGDVYTCTQNNWCPNEPFLVGLYDKGKFEYYLVILTESGLKVHYSEDEYFDLDLCDVEYWCKIEKP